MSFLRRPAAWVFAILLASYSYYWHARDWNSASRLMLTYALVDRGTIAIDGTERQTGDLAQLGDHYYTDKLPGFSFLATLPYAIVKLAFRLPPHPLGGEAVAHWPADYAITVLTSGVTTAWAAVVLVGLARSLGCGPRRSALVGLAYGLATPAYAYATLAYGHQVAASCLIGSFGLIRRRSTSRVGRRNEANPSGGPGQNEPIRCFMAGWLASYASVVELQVGPVSAILGLYLVTLASGRRRPIGSVLAFGLGVVGPAVILLSYNQAAFGSPWRMGYFYEVVDRFKEVHSAGNPLGLGRPDWSKLGELTWGSRRGMIRFAPILVLTVPGFAVLAWRRLWGPAIVSGSVIAAMFLMNLSYPEWTGGWSTGPRLLVPLLPFAMVQVAGLLASGGRAATASAVLLALIGAVVMLMYQAVGARIPNAIDRPWLDAVLPIWRGDRPLPAWTYGHRFARNLMSVAAPGWVAKLGAGFGWAQFLPLVVFQMAAIGVMFRVVKEPSGAIEARPPEDKIENPGAR